MLISPCKNLSAIVSTQNILAASTIVQQDTTPFGQQFKVDWRVPNTEEIELRTIWEITLTNPNPRLISAFVKLP